MNISFFSTWGQHKLTVFSLSIPMHVLYPWAETALHNDNDFLSFSVIAQALHVSDPTRACLWADPHGGGDMLDLQGWLHVVMCWWLYRMSAFFTAIIKLFCNRHLFRCHVSIMTTGSPDQKPHNVKPPLPQNDLMTSFSTRLAKIKMAVSQNVKRS